VNLLGSLALLEWKVDFDLGQSQTSTPQWLECRVLIEDRLVTHDFKRGIDR
jgi:hypothetical protein